MADNNLPAGQDASASEPEESGQQVPAEQSQAQPAAEQPTPAQPEQGLPGQGVAPVGQPGGYPTADIASPVAQGQAASTAPQAGPPAGVPLGGVQGQHPTPFQGAHTAQTQGQPQLTQEHPTQPFPDAFGQPAAGAPPVKQKNGGGKRTHSTGTFLAGLAAAALIGGIVGGGVSSLVVANSLPKNGSVSQQSGAVTLNNPETATEISGVAAVGTPSVVTLSVESQTEGGSGSGVIYSEDGYIITNAHVVTLDGAATDPTIRVKLSDGRLFTGTLVGVAPYSDIAVVKIDAEGLTPIEIADSSKVNVGDLAVAIGAPMSLSNTVTSGVVSALNRGISVGSALIPQDPSQEGQEAPDGEESPDGRGFPWDFRFDRPGEEQNTQQAGGQVTLPVVQTDASINPGNSGGALLNARAELIGINVAIASPGATEGKASSAGLGFAIPADLATRVADEIIAGEKPTHGLLGAGVVDSSADTDADANHAGGLIREVVRGGAAANAGLKVGDVITAVDGVPASDGTSVSALIRMHAGESEVSIDYTRNGVAGQVTATLGTLEW